MKRYTNPCLLPMGLYGSGRDFTIFTSYLTISHLSSGLTGMQVQYIRFALRKKARESKLPDLGQVTVLRVHSVPGKSHTYA